MGHVLLCAASLLALAPATPSQSGVGGRAQPEPPETEEATQSAQSGNQTITLLEQLNLTDEQKRQIREIRDEHETPLREAMRRRRRAQRALEEAFYSDRADEALIEARSRELADAQAELARLRTLIELRVRRVLTPAQLIRFREIRRQAAEVRARSSGGGRLNRALREEETTSPAERRANRLSRQRKRMEGQAPLRRPGLLRRRL